MNVEHSSDAFMAFPTGSGGDTTPAASYLIETPTAQAPNAIDPDVVNDKANPLARRSATHLATIDAVLSAHELLDGERTCWVGMPSYDDLVWESLSST